MPVAKSDTMLSNRLDNISKYPAPLDPHLLASKMTDDAALAYHTALEFQGRVFTFDNVQTL